MSFSYRHLHYFWVVGHEGGFARAASRLGVAVQTVSAQVHALEESLGHALLRPAGRGVALTEAGVAALRVADEIFQLGDTLPAAVRDAGRGPSLRLRVGVSDGLAKLVVHHLLAPLLVEDSHLTCHEDEFERLQADLALRRLDVVLADRAPAPNPNLKLFSRKIGSSDVAWFAPPGLLAAAKRGFPASLARVPVVLPTAHAAVRAAIDQWFAARSIQPRIVGEFEDSALMKTFAAAGLGVFPAAELVKRDVVSRYGVKPVGACDGVVEQFHAIAPARRIAHPMVSKLLGE